MRKNIQNEQPKQLRPPVDVLLGRASMMGFVLAFGAYLTADVLAPGLI